jgi:hypothetical protein
MIADRDAGLIPHGTKTPTYVYTTDKNWMKLIELLKEHCIDVRKYFMRHVDDMSSYEMYHDELPVTTLNEVFWMDP